MGYVRFLSGIPFITSNDCSWLQRAVFVWKNAVSTHFDFDLGTKTWNREDSKFPESHSILADSEVSY